MFLMPGGTAVSGVDFTSSDGELTFGVGETKKSINFVIIDDNQPEDRETFSIRLQQPQGKQNFSSCIFCIFFFFFFLAEQRELDKKK